MIKISPSILSADFVNLGRDIDAVCAAGADCLHIDVMDGLFVPNITVGLPVVKAIREYTSIPLDVHLMIDKPHRFVRQFCESGADIVTIHAEADQPQDIFAALSEIRAMGKKTGLSLKPKTPAEVIFPYLGVVDLILVMTVEPGFGGQSFMPEQLPKIRKIADELSRRGLFAEISVDGGIDQKTAPLVKSAGATVLAAGSYVFGSGDMRAAMDALR